MKQIIWSSEILFQQSKMPLNRKKWKESLR